jgi:hypothetical protein
VHVHACTTDRGRNIVPDISVPDGSVPDHNLYLCIGTTRSIFILANFQNIDGTETWLPVILSTFRPCMHAYAETHDDIYSLPLHVQEVLYTGGSCNNVTWALIQRVHTKVSKRPLESQ